MHLVISQGADFGLEMFKEQYSDIGEEDEEIYEQGDILWFNNVQMRGDEEGINAPTFLEYSKEVKSLSSIEEQKKKRNVTLNFLSTDMMINNCVCSKTNKYKCKCFGDHNL